MVTETVNIRFVESGARVVKRRIDEIGQAANSATRGIFLLKRALFVIGGAGIARGLQQYADSLTNMENRLRLTTDSTAQLEAVQSELFEVARRSRSDLAGTADIYNRIALSAKNFGVGQKQILAVTETLQKAAILSGASAREANAALIQLGQGIASDRLSGDELRSVLEQLPAVADILVDYLNKTGQFGNVTRGTLRELGRQGKLTADIIFSAIEAAQGRISQLFEETNPTIEQAFKVAETNLLQFIDKFDDATGASAAVAKAIISISENLDILLAGVLAVAAALTGLFTAKVLAAISAYVTKLQIAGGAFARLRSIQAASAAAQAAHTAAIANDTRIRVQNYMAIVARSNAQLRSAQAEYAEATAAFTNGRARDAQTGRFIANQVARDRLTAASIRLANAERINLALTNQLTAARVANTAAENAAAAAATRAAIAQEAKNTMLVRLSATFPLLTGAARMAGGAIAGVFSLIAAHPIGALITALVAAGIAVFTLGDRFKVTADGVVSLKDAAIAAFQIIFEWVGSVVSALGERLAPIINTVSQAFVTLGEIASSILGGIFQIFVSVFNAIAGTVVGFINGTIRSWQLLPAALIDIMNIARNGLLTIIENIVNGFIEGIKEIPNFFSRAMENIAQFARDAVTFIVDAFTALPGAISDIAEAAVRFLVAKFQNGINSIKRLLNTLPGISLSVGEDIQAAFDGLKIELPDPPSFNDFFREGRLSLDRFRGEVTGSAAEVGNIYAEEFANAYSRNLAGEAGQAISNAVESLGNSVINRARENLAKQTSAITDSPIDTGKPGTGGDGGGGGGGRRRGGGGGSSASFDSELTQLRQRIDLERQYGIQKEITNNILSIEKSIKRELTQTEAEQVANVTKLLEISKIQGQVLQEILGPQETLQFTQQALNELFAQGAITLEQYNTKLRETQIAADRAANTLGGGFRAAIASSIQSAGQFGEALGGVVVDAANRAADAIVEFAKTGKFNIRQFFQDLFAQLLKLAAQRLLLQFIGGLFGIPGGGLAKFNQGGSILPSFAGGGSIVPTGPGSTDSQIVAFNKRPDERVDILTPGQQAAQRNAMNSAGGGKTIVNTTTNIAAVLSPRDIVGAFDNSDGETVVVNMIQRNASTIRQIVQG